MKSTISENGLNLGAWIADDNMADPQRRGVVYRKKPSGSYIFGADGIRPCGMEYLIVFEDGARATVTDAQLSGDGGWRVMADQAPCAEEKIGEMLRKTESLNKKREDDYRKKCAEKEAARAALPAKYPHLKTFLAGGRVTPWALGASNIRTELKRAFPGVVFRVTSNSYAGGCSIRIAWTDGPCTRAVDEVAGKYQTCDFDGMQDLETYRDRVFSDVFGGAKYVQTERDSTPEGMREAWKRAGRTEEIPFDDHGSILWGWEWRDSAYRAWNGTNL